MSYGMYLCIVNLVVLAILANAFAAKNPIFKPNQQTRRYGCVGFLCNSTSNYPEDHIRMLLEKNKKFHNLRGSLLEPTEVQGLTFKSQSFEEENLCRTKRVMTIPKTAEDSDFNLYYIVNIKDFEQSVTFDLCAEKKCLLDSASCLEKLHYKTQCKQLYNNVGLVYLTEHGKLGYKKFKVPSACVCAYTKS